MEEKILYHLRKDYSQISLDTEHLNKDPFVQFGEWFDNALSQESQEANAMILSTSSISGKPSSRVVLLKSFSKQGFVFFTNYNSKKGKDIEENPNVSVLFFWPSAMRQI
ncbi:MAG: pyridoxamine 5'-phosphate oxidase family protein, partial [Bacteroidales bacterium]|nr:pyridoxamine 5'-phosphate oxidase family protein [Bacteroidales bacterium]